MTTASDIIDFWFPRSLLDSGKPPEMWFQGGAEADAKIQKRFGDDVERARDGAYDEWTAKPEGTLALVVLLDQFTRNIHRGTPDAFAGDEKALGVSRAAIERGHDLQLGIPQRAFLYMPLEHAEYAGAQEQSIAVFERLAADAGMVDDGKWKKMADMFLDYAHQHKAIIDRFGRYPHRNEILGRETTDDEAEFLKEPNSSF